MCIFVVFFYCKNISRIYIVYEFIVNKYFETEVCNIGYRQKLKAWNTVDWNTVVKNKVYIIIRVKG